MESVGLTPQAEHYNPLIALLAQLGNTVAAQEILQALIEGRAEWGPPNTQSFNAYLEGVVDGMDPRELMGGGEGGVSGGGRGWDGPT